MGQIPDWVERQKRKGTVIKHIGDRYYLYSNSSRRVPGKKYPQPVQKCLGEVTPEGLVMNVKIPFENSGIRVYEYGFSAVLLTLWKRDAEVLSRYGKEALKSLIQRESPDSWFLKEFGDADAKEEEVQECRDLIEELSNHSFEELRNLGNIKMIQFNAETRVLSYVDDEQKNLLSELDVNLYDDVALI